MSKGFTEQDLTSQKGKTFVITGANTGLGYEAARALCSKGARVLIACRSEHKASEAIARIRGLHPQAELDYVPLDLGSLASVKDCAKQLQKEEKIDVLINNAGIMVPPYELTTEGFESQFGVNHLGPFALTSLLLDTLSKAPNARVVNTSSIAHKTGKMFFNDIDAEKSYSASARYSQSKLANLLFNCELQRRLHTAGSTTISVACHPGIADTELSRYLPGVLKAAMPITRSLFNSAAQGAWPTLYAATGDTIKGGDYTGPGKRWETAGPAVRVGSTRRSRNPQLAAQLWDISCQMTGIDPGI